MPTLPSYKGWKFHYGTIKKPPPSPHGVYTLVKSQSSRGPSGNNCDSSSWQSVDLAHDYLLIDGKHDHKNQFPMASCHANKLVIADSSSSIPKTARKESSSTSTALLIPSILVQSGFGYIFCFLYD